ncbi:hypothetical protein BN439_3142 [Erwinia amylovora Ea644]|nr:hypothetical protein BN439_3142 [Erwinia amylovora Ea644]
MLTLRVNKSKKKNSPQHLIIIAGFCIYSAGAPARLLTRRENIKNLLKMSSCPQSVQLIFCR